LFDVASETVVFSSTVIALPKRVDKALRNAKAAVEAAEKLARESEVATLRAAQVLTKEGVSLRDAGRLLNLSRQRIHQILAASARRR
jgi:DNA-directed RNA polymerase sigma subunit (sigma70/sigma32)